MRFIITGGGSGIGGSLASRLAALGKKVVVVGRLLGPLQEISAVDRSALLSKVKLRGNLIGASGLVNMGGFHGYFNKFLALGCVLCAVLQSHGAYISYCSDSDVCCLLEKG